MKRSSPEEKEVTDQETVVDLKIGISYARSNTPEFKAMGVASRHCLFPHERSHFEKNTDSYCPTNLMTHNL